MPACRNRVVSRFGADGGASSVNCIAFARGNKGSPRAGSIRQCSGGADEVHGLYMAAGGRLEIRHPVERGRDAREVHGRGEEAESLDVCASAQLRLIEGHIRLRKSGECVAEVKALILLAVVR
jgi:hypothetical protein